MSIARSSLALFGTRGASVGLGFLAVLVFAREIGIAALGSYFLFQALLDVTAFGTDLGLKSAVEKRISEGRPADEVLGTGLALKFILLTAGAVVVLALRGPISSYVGADLAVPLVGAAALREAGRLTTFVLRGEIRVGESATVELAQKATFAVVGVVLAVQGFGVRAPVYGLLAGYAVMTALGAVRIGTGLAAPSTAMARSMLSYSVYQSVGHLRLVGYSWIDVLVIGAFLSPAAVGAYEVAWKVASIATVFSDALATAAFPRLSEYWGRGEFDRIGATVTRLLTPSLALVFPALFGTLVLGESILGILFGPAYTTATLALVVLMADNISSAVYLVVTRALSALDVPELNAQGVTLNVTLNVGLNLLLVPRYGLIGAAVATSLAALAGQTLSLYHLSRIVPVRLQWGMLGWCLVASAGMAVVVFLVRRGLTVDTPPELAALVLLGVVSYPLFVLLSPSVRASAREGIAALRATDT